MLDHKTLTTYLSTRKTSPGHRRERLREPSGRYWSPALPLEVWPDIPGSSLCHIRLHSVLLDWLYGLSLRASRCQSPPGPEDLDLVGDGYGE